MIIEVRQQDCQGAGWFEAPRGKRLHKGIDIASIDDEIIIGETAIHALAPGRVSKIGYPHAYRHEHLRHYRYVEITVCDGMRWRYFYVAPTVAVGDVIERGGAIGAAQHLTDVYPGITPHYHFEIMAPGTGYRTSGTVREYIDPVPELEALGYVIRPFDGCF